MATYYKLEKINIIADGDKDFIEVLVKTFLEEVPVDQKLLQEAVENNNKEQAYLVAHKMKPTLELFGLESFKSLLAIQDWGKKRKELENVNVQMSQINKAINKAVIELKKDFKLE